MRGVWHGAGAAANARAGRSAARVCFRETPVAIIAP